MVFGEMHRYFFLIGLVVECLYCNASGSNMNDSYTNVHFSNWKHSWAKQRVLAGSEASHSQYRFVVAIMRKDNKSSDPYEICTGGVVKKDLILTACHCVGDVRGVRISLFDPRKITIIAGTANIYEDSPQRQVLTVRSFQAHWKCQFYQPGTIIETDVALIMLKDTLELGNDVQPFNMAEREPKALDLRLRNQIRMKTVCKLGGYGFSEPKIPTKTLLEAELQLISDYECRRIFCEKAPNSPYCNHDYGIKNGFCAIPTDPEEGATPCKGDSGAPVVCDGYVYGLLIWGGCRPEYPVVIAKGTVALELIKFFHEPKYGSQRKSSNIGTQTELDVVLLTIFMTILNMVSTWRTK